MTTTERLIRHAELDEQRRELQALLDTDRAFTRRLGISDEQLSAAAAQLAEVRSEQQALLAGCR